jgi:hypothetical protein
VLTNTIEHPFAIPANTEYGYDRLSSSSVEKKNRKRESMTKGLFSLLLVTCFTSTVNAGGAVAITQGNFDALTKGKNSFIKFLAPW